MAEIDPVMAEPGDDPVKRCFYVITYDVTDDRRRYKLSKALEGFGERVQDSVFECLLSQSQYSDMRKRTERWVDTKLDSIRYYNLGAVKRADVEVLGGDPVTSVPIVYTV